jgi:hypothetical protein
MAAFGGGAGATSFSEIGGTMTGAGVGTSIGGGASAVGPGAASSGGGPCGAGWADTSPALATAATALSQTARLRCGIERKARVTDAYSGVQAS